MLLPGHIIVIFLNRKSRLILGQSWLQINIQQTVSGKLDGDSTGELDYIWDTGGLQRCSIIRPCDWSQLKKNTANLAWINIGLASHEWKCGLCIRKRTMSLGVLSTGKKGVWIMEQKKGIINTSYSYVTNYRNEGYCYRLLHHVPQWW